MSSTVELVKTAASPQAALLAIAKALDRIEAQLLAAPAPEPDPDPWGSWGGDEPAVTSEVSDDEITVNLPVADERRQALRREFAKRIQLQEAFPSVEDADECFAKGGPLWLYLGSKEGRDFVLGLPFEFRQAMVRDVAEDSTTEAQQMGRDILKDMQKQGPGFTMETLFGVELDG